MQVARSILATALGIVFGLAATSAIARGQATPDPTTNPTTEPSPPSAPATTPTTRPTVTAGTEEDGERAARMRALIAAAATQAAAATAPSFVTTPARPMSNEFSVLRSRSMFLKGRSPTNSGGAGSATTRETPRRPEDSLIFNGVTDADGAIVAFVEDTSAGGRVTRVRVGESIARGKVVRITLERLDYESGGKVTSIEIGQTLSGAFVGASASTQPSAAPLSDDPNDIVSRMRRARMEGR